MQINTKLESVCTSGEQIVAFNSKSVKEQNIVYAKRHKPINKLHILKHYAMEPVNLRETRNVIGQQKHERSHLICYLRKFIEFTSYNQCNKGRQISSGS
jgi:hypothetical protein